MVKLVWLYAMLLKVTETIKMVSENLLYLFVESWNRLWCLIGAESIPSGLSLKVPFARWPFYYVALLVK